MVRTRGPWRCVFSKGSAARVSVGEAAAGSQKDASPKKSSEDASIPAKDAVNEGTSCRNDGPDKEESSGESEMHQPCSAAHSDDELAHQCSKASGQLALVKRKWSPVSGSDGESRTVEVVKGGADSSLTTDGPSNIPAESETECMEWVDLETETAEEGILYVNQDTGEVTREPPPELLVKTGDAERAGEYLVFVPCRSFVAALREKSSSAAIEADTGGRTLLAPPAVGNVSADKHSFGSEVRRDKD